MGNLKLYMLLLGATPPGRHTEQHDVFFAIGDSLKALLPAIHNFWPEAEGRLHIDAWREVTVVEGYRVEVVDRMNNPDKESQKLFFINLGGYRRGVFDEPHFKILTVQASKGDAIRFAKATPFFQDAHFARAESHVDDKYGVDVDDLYEIEEILPAGEKEKYSLKITAGATGAPDDIHLGYFKLSSLV